MPAAVVIPQPDGSVSVPVRVDELVPAPCEEHAEILSAVVPVLAEEREVQERRVEAGTVRLTKVVREREVQVDEVVEEVLVVKKRWMLREEIHIRQQRIETHQPQQTTLRSEDVQVERIAHTDEDQ